MTFKILSFAVDPIVIIRLSIFWKVKSAAFDIAQEAYKMDFHLSMVRLIWLLITASDNLSASLKSQKNIKNFLA